MKLTRSFSFLIAVAIGLSSCGDKKPSTAEEIAKTREATEERQKKEDEEKLIKEEEQKKKEEEEAAEKEKVEAAEKAVKAPNKRGEYTVVVSPDANVRSSYVVPVHLFSVSETGAQTWQAKSADEYWASPVPGAKAVTFGTKPGARQAPFSVRAPFKDGDDFLVVVAKKAGITRPTVIPLKRKEGVTPESGPVIPVIKLRVTSAGVTAE